MTEKQRVSESEMDEFFDKVYYLFSTGRAEEALARLDTIDEDNPDYARALFYKSMISSALGDEDAAKELYKESVISEVSKTSGIDSDVLRNDDFDNVVGEMNDITDSVIAFNEGFDYYTDGDFEKALNLFDMSLGLNPNDAETLYFKALSLANMEDFELALEMIGRAIELDWQDDRFWNDKANFLTRMGRYSEAEKSFSRAIELNPTDSVLFANKGFMYLQMEEYGKSLECYKKAYALDSGNIHNIVCLANVYVELYDFPKADKYFSLASKIDDTDEEYLTAMAHYMMYQERLDESIGYWDELLDINPDKAEVWLYKAMTYMMMNNVVDATWCIKKASEIDPDILDLFEDEISNFIDDDM